MLPHSKEEFGDFVQMCSTIPDMQEAIIARLSTLGSGGYMDAELAGVCCGVYPLAIGVLADYVDNDVKQLCYDEIFNEHGDLSMVVAECRTHAMAMATISTRPYYTSIIPMRLWDYELANELCNENAILKMYLRVPWLLDMLEYIAALGPDEEHHALNTYMLTDT